MLIRGSVRSTGVIGMFVDVGIGFKFRFVGKLELGRVDKREEDGTLIPIPEENSGSDGAGLLVKGAIWMSRSHSIGIGIGINRLMRQ